LLSVSTADTAESCRIGHRCFTQESTFDHMQWYKLLFDYGMDEAVAEADDDGKE
jgi:hypothetical protein